MNDLCIGPYVGNFKYEYLYFIPFLNWVRSVIPHEKVFVSTHFNREFLYRDKCTRVFHIQPFLSVDEENQKTFYHKKVYKNHYCDIESSFLQYASKYSNNKLLNYSFYNNKFNLPYSTFQMKYTPLCLEKDEKYKDTIAFIPDIKEKEEYSKKLYSELCKKFGKKKIIVLGDKRTWLKDKNHLLKNKNYHSIIYNEMMKILNSCSCVVTPASEWTGILNLQKIPVFSWGNNIQQYKKSGRFWFNNTQSSIIPKTSIEKLMKNLELFYSKLEEEKC